MTDLKLVTNADSGTADIVGGDDWDAAATKINTYVNDSRAGAYYTVYLAGSNIKAFNGVTKVVDYTSTDFYTTMTNVFAAIPAVGGEVLLLDEVYSQGTGTLNVPNFTKVRGEGGKAQILVTGDFPIFTVGVSKGRITLDGLDLRHNQSGYTSGLLQIREGAQENTFKNLLFFDNNQKKGNGLHLYNAAAAGSTGLFKNRFINCEFYGFEDCVRAEITNNSNWINGNSFTHCEFWLPTNSAYKTLGNSTTNHDANNFFNCQVQAQTSGGNQTACGFDYDHTGRHWTNTHVGCIVYDLGTGSHYARTNANTELVLIGCTPAWKIGGSVPSVVRPIGWYTRATGRSVFSGDGSTKTFTVTHNMNASQAPNIVLVKEGSSDSVGSWYVNDATISTTQFTITYPIAPPTGTNNLVYYWEVGYQPT